MQDTYQNLFLRPQSASVSFVDKIIENSGNDICRYLKMEITTYQKEDSQGMYKTFSIIHHSGKLWTLGAVAVP